MIASRIRRRLARQDGAALVTCIAMGAMLGTAGASAMVYAAHNYGDAKRSDANARAFALAEAGLNDAYSILYNAPNPTLPTAVPVRTQNVYDGKISWSGTLDATGSTWTLTGVGTVRSPVHAADVTRRVSGRVKFTNLLTASANNAVWNYMYSDATTGCMPINNSAAITVPLYVRGNLCMSNTASFSGYQLEVGGILTLANSAHVGANSASPVTHDVHVKGGCSLDGGASVHACSSADRVWSEVAADANTDTFTKPPVDIPGWYEDAAPGPRHPCTSGSFPGGFDNDSTMNGSRGTVDLVPATAYDCTVTDADGKVLGRIAWQPGSPGTLTVAGTIFVDGDILFSQQNHVVYQGKATVYASGKITVDNYTTICAVSDCASSWNPNDAMLSLVAGSNAASNAFSMNNHTTLQGAVYVVGDYRADNNTDVFGPVIANQIYVSNSTINHFVPIGSLLPGMPASYTKTITLVNQTGSWGS